MVLNSIEQTKTREVKREIEQLQSIQNNRRNESERMNKFSMFIYKNNYQAPFQISAPYF